jgi:Lrp/AsnC family leucine-responsive transcriptional regulator
LKALLRDARASFTDIARDCSVSTNAIAKRFSRLKKSGIIIGTTLVTSMPEGKEHSLAVDLKVKNHLIDNVAEEIRKMPGFAACFKILGSYDIHAAFHVESMLQADKIRNYLKRKNGVLKIVLTFSLDRDHYFPENLLIKATGGT